MNKKIKYILETKHKPYGILIQDRVVISKYSEIVFLDLNDIENLEIKIRELKSLLKDTQK